MKIWPLRFRELGPSRVLFADDAGGYFVSDPAFLQRYVDSALSDTDRKFLYEHGHAFNRVGDLQHTSFTWRWTARQSAREKIAYVILVPTLRCNLTCTYCQVSRAAENAKGYDWDTDTLEAVLGFLDRLETDEIKVEFQGGEPLLRSDLLRRVRDHCRKRFSRSEFVVCTNLQRLGPDEIGFLDAVDTYTSTSLDGGLLHHERYRTRNRALTEEFFENLDTVVQRFGQRVSALPTVDIDDPPEIETLVTAFESYGFSSIYLRPVNYHGFARRRRAQRDDLSRWNAFYDEFIDFLIDRNFQTGHVMEEFYLSLCLRRMLQPGHDGHVDLRNPSLPASDYVLIDFDGRLYPSDEARMLSRIGQIDLSIGTAHDGIDQEAIAARVPSAFNNFDPDCIHCPYQPFCGTDPIDDVSRYRRVDIPRQDTWFCGRQLAVFDKAMSLIYSSDERVLYSLRKWAGLATWPNSLAPEHHDTSAHTS
ncbi:His-Xaa-Ser system radical SAM maturase HxsB [Oricola sp.]|uniref:His-Xaa-Ser system radical SAM maturase HxsB n=1 Tax=Oricola sp. TaxID=1979950 RepID=UPI0025F70B30|nr:His-Xaa-Ser system radical SAM maturase HxsB [Oricola sp.]MCI5073976.1 His-Xaa-Ser system radical SAM maturase HxsB [Oricola sp.]